MTTKERARNILVAVDVQNDFIDGSLAVHEGAQVVQPINEVADAVRSTDGSVIFTRDWHPPVTPHFDEWPSHCVAKTNGAAFHPDLNIEDSDIIISKGTEQTHGYSGWDGESERGETIESIVTPRTPDEIVNVLLGGLATEYCVETTALDTARGFASDRRVRMYVLIDAIRGINKNPNDSEEAIQAMRDANIAAITSSEARALIEGTGK